MHRRTLFIRLSSFGDVVAAKQVLDFSLSYEQGSVEIPHIIVDEAYAFLFSDQKRYQAIPVNRKNLNFFKWVKFIFRLQKQNKYQLIIDWHGSTRSCIAKIIFSTTSGLQPPKVFTYSKDRIRRWGYQIFKRNWPNSLRPRSMYLRYADILQKASNRAQLSEKDIYSKHVINISRVNANSPIAVAPSSAWPGKEWPVEKYVALCKTLSESKKRIAVFGAPYDRSARELIERLVHLNIAFERWDNLSSLGELAARLKGCSGVVSGDTGIAHLAAHVGVRVCLIYGPTRKDYGFGIYSPLVRSLESKIWCSPCSMDGSACFRLGASKYKCLKEISVNEVFSNALEHFALSL